LRERNILGKRVLRERKILVAAIGEGSKSSIGEEEERERERKWGFDCVWLRLDFYFQNAYVASPDWGCKSGVLHGLRIEFNLIDDGVWVRRNFVWWRVIVCFLFFLAYASSSSA
jgi:hypothetical protein